MVLKGLNKQGSIEEGEEKNDTSYKSRVATIKLLLVPNCSTSSTSFMDSVVILQRPSTNEYINAVRLLCRSIYKLRCYV